MSEREIRVGDKIVTGDNEARGLDKEITATVFRVESDTDVAYYTNDETGISSWTYRNRVRHA